VDVVGVVDERKRKREEILARHAHHEIAHVEAELAYSNEQLNLLKRDLALIQNPTKGEAVISSAANLAVQ